MPDLNEIFGSTFALTAVLVTVPVLVVIVVLLFVIARGRRSAEAVKSWSQTTGHILQSYVGRRSSNHSSAYYAEILYEYVVDGRRYQSTQVRPGIEIGFGARSIPQQMVDRFPVGATVPVFFDPTNPTQSVLEQTPSSGNKVLMFAIFLIIASLGCSAAFIFGMNGFLQQIINQFTGFIK